MLVGYARVSTQDQNLDLQNDALSAAGCERIFTDTASGARAERPGLTDALAACRSGDTLVVWKLDRLGRSLPHLVETVRELAGRKIGFKSLQESIDTTTSSGKLIFHIFASLAEFERDLIRERTMAGLSAARARGRMGGRPPGVDEKKRQAALSLKADPQRSVKDICDILGISRNTYYKYTRTEQAPAQRTGGSAVTPPHAPKVMQVELYLRVENNSKYVRGKTKVREEIERFVLSHYGVKAEAKGGPYTLTIPYETDEELDRIVYDILTEAQSIADLRNCFTEADATSLDDPERQW